MYVVRSRYIGVHVSEVSSSYGIPNVTKYHGVSDTSESTVQKYKGHVAAESSVKGHVEAENSVQKYKGHVSK